MMFDITWHMTLLLISISLELFFAAKHTPNKCVRGHGFPFLSQLTWKGCRFLCSCCSLSYPASSGMGLDRRPLHAVPAPPAAITPPASVSLL